MFTFKSKKYHLVTTCENNANQLINYYITSIHGSLAFGRLVAKQNTLDTWV